MDITHMGEAMVKLLVERGYLKDIADIYELPEHRQELMEIERYGQLSIDNLLRSIEGIFAATL